MTKIVEFIENLFLQISNVILFLMMLIIFLDGILRYLFKSPIPGGHDFVELYLIVAIVFFGMSATFKAGRHITIDIFVNKYFNEKAKKYLHVFSDLISLIFIVLLFIYSSIFTYNSWINNEIMTGIVNWPLYTAYVLVPIGLIVFIFRILISLFEHLKSLKNS